MCSPFSFSGSACKGGRASRGVRGIELISNFPNWKNCQHQITSHYSSERQVDKDYYLHCLGAKVNWGFITFPLSLRGKQREMPRNSCLKGLYCFVSPCLVWNMKEKGTAIKIVWLGKILNSKLLGKQGEGGYRAFTSSAAETKDWVSLTVTPTTAQK